MEERRTFDLVWQQHTEDEIARYEDLKREIKELRETVKSLVDIWNQTKGVVSFVKWILGISGSVGAFILFVKDHVK